ncbi:MAG: DUF3302 domain-containing protein [Proteobacteria bacterium]|nr:DUF3302 domain-containing protein [Pseudomonadota bacterium]
MSGLDIFALIVLLIIVGSALAIFIFMGLLPGKVAKQNNHPQVEAITIGSWVALLAGGILWPLILIWAYIKSETGDRT